MINVIRISYASERGYADWLKKIGFKVFWNDSFMFDSYRGQFCDGTDDGHIARENLNSLFKVYLEIRNKRLREFEV